MELGKSFYFKMVAGIIGIGLAALLGFLFFSRMCIATASSAAPWSSSGSCC